MTIFSLWKKLILVIYTYSYMYNKILDQINYNKNIYEFLRFRFQIPGD